MPIYLKKDGKVQEIRDIIVKEGGHILNECPLIGKINSMTVSFIDYIKINIDGSVSGGDKFKLENLISLIDKFKDKENVEIVFNDGDYDFKGKPIKITRNNLTIKGSNNSKLKNLELTFEKCNNILLEDCNITNEGRIYFRGCKGAIIRHNIIEDGYVGVLSDNEDIDILHNTIWSNSKAYTARIDVTTSKNVNILGNFLYSLNFVNVVNFSIGNNIIQGGNTSVSYQISLNTCNNGMFFNNIFNGKEISQQLSMFTCNNIILSDNIHRSVEDETVAGKISWNVYNCINLIISGNIINGYNNSLYFTGESQDIYTHISGNILEYISSLNSLGDTEATYNISKSLSDFKCTTKDNNVSLSE